MATKKTATKKTATKKATTKKTAAKKSAARTATKTTAKKAAIKKAAKKATKKPRIDPLRELAWDVLCAFDAEDATPAVQLEFVDGFLATAADRGIAVDLDVALPYCAEVLGLEPGELRATYEGHSRQLAAVHRASGRAGEVDALVELCAKEGRFGDTFQEAAARALADAWPRLGAALGQRLFVGRKDLRLRRAGPFATLAGFEAARDVRWLELVVTPDCDLAPLAALTKLQNLHLSGKLAGYGVLARLARLTTLQIEADAAGLAELASLPTLRVLTLTVAEDVSLAGLLDLKQLGLLKLLAGSRRLDEVTAATIAALAKKKTRKLLLAQHEGWPLQLTLTKRTSPGYVEIN
ncbi:hypothetical protein [Nannocystis punicea]|uniref:Uncharacterized protein n=1 Tax=Nannocystis punicea TaxID=2995304 RepID=A0ABY7H778_9BACT|nr:hypothetical protein [Nannocystis poenicansa]WAS94922.1 hypothetical protein O0S08_02070 [Nannocystis poenicansa]